MGRKSKMEMWDHPRKGLDEVVDRFVPQFQAQDSHMALNPLTWKVLTVFPSSRQSDGKPSTYDALMKAIMAFSGDLGVICSWTRAINSLTLYVVEEERVD
jgi:hypothetical protein